MLNLLPFPYSKADAMVCVREKCRVSDALAKLVVSGGVQIRDERFVSGRFARYGIR
jgi:hypothetical protein